MYSFSFILRMQPFGAILSSQETSPQRRRKQFRAGGGGSISKKGTLYYFGKQAEKPKFKK